MATYLSLQLPNIYAVSPLKEAPKNLTCSVLWYYCPVPE